MHKLLALSLGLLFAAAPSSSNYTLKNYDIGGSGSSSSSSSNYNLNAQTGSQSGTTGSSSYGAQSGVIASENSNVPPAPLFTNPANFYDHLALTIATGNNPSDTKYLIAISPNNFVTTYYVQTDHSIGTSQALTNYQTYTAWGGSSGFIVLGLQPSTTYTVKVKALQGNGTGSAFGPSATASTAATSLTVSLGTSQSSTPPFGVSFTNLTPGSVTTGSADALIGVTSNANNGGFVYVKSANAGLYSTSSNTTIASASADLNAATSGYGALVTAASQSAGGPLSSLSPYNGTSPTVGALNTQLQPILSTAGPVTGGSGTVRLLAKASTTTPSAADYSDTLTFVIAMNY